MGTHILAGSQKYEDFDFRGKLFEDFHRFTACQQPMYGQARPTFKIEKVTGQLYYLFEQFATVAFYVSSGFAYHELP